MDHSADRTHSVPQPAYLKPANFSSLLQDIPEDLMFESRTSTQSISTASSSSRSVNSLKSPASSIRSASTGSSRPRKSVRFGEVASASTSISSFEMDSSPESKPVPAAQESRQRGWRQSLSRGMSMPNIHSSKKAETSTSAPTSTAQSDFEAWLTRMPKLDNAANAPEPRTQARRSRSMMAEVPGVPEPGGRVGRKGRRQSWVNLFAS